MLKNGRKRPRRLNSANVQSCMPSAHQRWSPRGRPWPGRRPRGHIFKSLALASKIALSSARGQHYFLNS